MTDAAESSVLAYEYEPLNLTKDQIRLVIIKPGPEDSTIECTLDVFDKDNAPEYITLSYTWGSPTMTRLIRVNGRSLSVRQNLYEFLTCYRNDKTNTCHIWIDQICISQAHTSERNHQVAMMARIYEGCLHAIIWLGRESEQLALDFSQRRWGGQYLAANDYFRRLWIVQEVVLSPKQVILCGNTWVKAEDLGSRLNAIVEDVGGGPQMMAYYLLHGAYAKTFELENALELFAEQECEDVRDKVYGLMSLVPPSERVVIDYQRTTEEVFLDVVMIMSLASLHMYELLSLSERLGLREHRRALERLIRSLEGLAFTKIVQYGFIRSETTKQEPTWWYIHESTKFEFSANGGHL